jgi:hypothetical protein
MIKIAFFLSYFMLDHNQILLLMVNSFILNIECDICTQLRVFKRITFAASQSEVVFEVNTRKDLALYNEENKWVVEPGVFEIMIGASNDDIRMPTQFTV